MRLTLCCARLGLALFPAFGFAAGSAAGAGVGQAATLRWATEADASSLDPYTRNETAQLSLLGNIYEPLIRRAADLSLQPALATAWEQTAPTRWRFHLRPGVLWQDGTAFTAADVLFSLRRVQAPTSMLRSVAATIAGATAPDALTVDFDTVAPDPILPREMTSWYMMSASWAAAHDTAQPALLAERREDFATRHAMGTGPYAIAERDPDHRTVLERNPAWWDKPAELVGRIEMDVLATATTRVAALVSGEVDLATAIPPQDAAYVGGTAGIRLLATPELRTIVLGMDQWRDELLKSDIHGRNPFRDARVREAVALAIDEDAIARKVMRGQAHPTWLLWGPGVAGYNQALDERPAPDDARAKQLLTEAGYADGFGVTLDCPNDRYVMDEQICTAIAAMLARVGIRVDVNAQPKARFFAEIGPPRFATSFYLLGWSPPTDDAENVLLNLAATRGGARGAINYGGMSDPALDSLIAAIGSESDPAARAGLIDRAARTIQSAFAYIPLHQQRLLWGARAGVDVPQSADGFLQLRLVRLSDKAAAKSE